MVNWVVYVEKIHWFTWRIGHLTTRTPKKGDMGTGVSCETKSNWSFIRAVVKDCLELTRLGNDELLKNGPFPSSTEKVGK